MRLKVAVASWFGLTVTATVEFLTKQQLDEVDSGHLMVGKLRRVVAVSSMANGMSEDLRREVRCCFFFLCVSDESFRRSVDAGRGLCRLL